MHSGGTGARALATWAAVCVLTAAPASLAQQAAPGGGSNDKVAAEALFEQGRALLAQGKYAEACPRFADSERLDPSSGTLLNLANCYEKLGRTATAWATYREAASAASAAGRADYLGVAQRHADALAPKLAKLTATVTQAVGGMVVRRDGVEMARSEWGVPIPIDSGSHTVEAEAPGYKTWSTDIDVPQDGALVTVTVPALEAAPVQAAPPAPSPSPAAAPTEATAPGPAAGDVTSGSVGSGQRVAGIVIAAVGLAGLGASGVFAVLAKNTYSDSLGNCQPNNPGLCNSTGVSQRNDARTDGNIASVAFGVGAAALVGGVIVWLTAPRASSASAASLVVAPTLGGAVVQGAF
jgi:serine/threonine-protein kinase